MRSSASAVRRGAQSLAPIISAGAATVILRLPRAVRPRAPVQWAASILCAGAVTQWLASGQKAERSQARTLLSAFAWAAASFLIVLPALSRTLILTSLVGPLLATIVLAHFTWGLMAAWRKGAFGAGDFRRRMEAILSEVVPSKVAQLAAAEATVIRYVFTWRSHPDCSGAKAFTYHGGGFLPLIWTIASLSVVEVFGVHLVIQHWSKPAAFIVSAVSELGVLYLVGIANSFRSLPILVDQDGVTIRLGLLIEQRITWSSLTRAERTHPGATKLIGTVQATAVMPANVRLYLSHSVKVERLFKSSREATTIDIYLDQPEDFLYEIRVGKLTA